MGVDIGGHRFLLVGSERRCRQAGVDLVEDEHLDIRLGLLLLPEPIQFRKKCLHPLPLDLAEIVRAALFEYIEIFYNRRRRLSSQTSTVTR